MEDRDDPIATRQDGAGSISQEERDANDSGTSTLPNLEGEVRALTAWIQAIDKARGADSFLSRTVENSDDLCDGVAFFEILSTIDSTYFRNPHGGEVKDNWILKTATLKRLFKLVTQYYIEILHQSPSALDVPDLDALARDGSKQDLYRLGSLVIGIAVRSDQANEHIAAIQSLPLEDQQQLMYTIEQVMGALQPIENKVEDEDDIHADHSASHDLLSEEQNEQSGIGSGDLKSESTKDNSAEMERIYAALLDENRTLKNSLEDTQAEKEEIVKEHTRFREEVERDRNMQADVLMRQEIERLKATLRRSEDNLAEAESEVERLNASVLDLTKKSEELQRKTEENTKMKDELEELRHASDKLQRTENAMEKFKKKLEEASEVKRQLKTLEAQNAELIDRNAAVEDEYKRVAHFKPLMDSYKEQIANLESKASNLQRDLNSARYDSEQVSAKLRATEEARTKEKEELDLYQERIQELELGGSVDKKASTGGMNGSDGLTSSTDIGSDEDVDENLEDAMSGTTMAGLKIRVRKLTRELEVAQANKADASKLLVVENLLQDANKMKVRYEHDYLKEYQKNMKMQKQIDAIQEGKSDLGDGAEANIALRMRLNETVEELEKIKKALSDLEVEHEQNKKELTIARSDLNLVDKNKLEMIEEVRAEVNVEKAELERTMKQLQEEKSSKEEQIRMQLSQINTLLMEKVDLQNDSIEQRDGALQRELEMGDLRSNKETVAKMEEQLKTLQEKLQKAKSLLREQHKMMSDAKNANAQGQIAPEELVKQAKELQLENKVLRQEQRLMASAYYDLKQREIRNAITSSGPLSNSSRAQTKAAIDINGLKPKSWHMQQNTYLNRGINLARR